MNEIYINLILQAGVIITAISAALYQWNRAKREDRNNKQKLDALEHKMVLDIAAKYSNLVEPLELRIKRLEEQLREQREHYEEQISTRDSQIDSLREKLQLYEAKIIELERTKNTQKQMIDELYEEQLRLRRELKELRSEKTTRDCDEDNV